MKQNPYPTLAALSAMLRADDARAVRYVVDALEQTGGNVRDTAAAIGCSLRTLYDWRDANPRLARAFEEHALGRTGAARVARQAHAEQLKTQKRKRQRRS